MICVDSLRGWVPQLRRLVSWNGNISKLISRWCVWRNYYPLMAIALASHCTLKTWQRCDVGNIQHIDINLNILQLLCSRPALTRSIHTEDTHAKQSNWDGTDRHQKHFVISFQLSEISLAVILMVVNEINCLESESNQIESLLPIETS